METAAAILSRMNTTANPCDVSTFSYSFVRFSGSLPFTVITGTGYFSERYFHPN